jgi:UDP-N-acetylmuramoyl-L-alanyl-D-glutamate--2,6-diaminopimelate ligase
MKLKELLQGCDYINSVIHSTPSLTLPPRGGGQGWGGSSGTLNSELNIDSSLDIDISGIAYDSRKVKEACLFVAITGERYDGHDFIKDAIKKGAVAIVYEKEINIQSLVGGQQSSVKTNDQDGSLFASGNVILIRVNDSRKTLARLANNFYEMPSKNLTLIGVTGTNGKTTTTYILKSILEAWGKKVGLIGTIQYLIHDRVYPALHTTPESLEFHGLLKDMLLSGCTHVISEVSSHALAQFRVDRAAFNAVVFTNLTRDHLDFHKNMEDYFRAKERLFLDLLDKDGTAIINIDDPYGKRLVSSLVTRHPSQDILTYGLEAGADIMAGDIKSSFQGLKFKISFRGRSYDISSHLTGLTNVYNILSAVGVSISLGIPRKVILEGLVETGNVTGRFEKVDKGQGFLCIVDYAHTEDALERLIYTARELIKKSEVSNTPSLTLPPPRPRSAKRGGRGGGQGWGGASELRTRNSSPRVITVFGCGGDRDHGKRPRMGAIATRLSDFVVITSDNPRSEEPSGIIKEIEDGAVAKNYVIESDRREAIRKAVNMASDGDIVLVAGKGHEDYQEIKGVRYRFNDREVLEEVLKNKLNPSCHCEPKAKQSQSDGIASSLRSSQ